MTVATKTVLLVEDNEDNRIIYATALRYAGYSVLEAITVAVGVAVGVTVGVGCGAPLTKGCGYVNVPVYCTPLSAAVYLDETACGVESVGKPAPRLK